MRRSMLVAVVGLLTVVAGGGLARAQAPDAAAASFAGLADVPAAAPTPSAPAAPSGPADVELSSELPLALTWAGRNVPHVVTISDAASGRQLFQQRIEGGTAILQSPSLAILQEFNRKLAEATAAHDVATVLALSQKVVELVKQAEGEAPQPTGAFRFECKVKAGTLKVPGSYAWTVTEAGPAGQPAAALTGAFVTEPRYGECFMCNGAGKYACHDCQGKGYVVMASDGTIIGNGTPTDLGGWRRGGDHHGGQLHTRACPTCRGSGQIKCTFCEGTGRSVTEAVVPAN